MAFRIHDSVVRGEIDNRVKGIVRGKIWVEGRDEPVTLELKGKDAVRFFHTERYELLAWVIMPNHVHVLFKVTTVPMAEILESWKKYTAVKANRMLNRRGAFWMADYWDTFMRDAEHERKTICYIENNPAKAKLVLDPKEWPWSSARFRDASGRLCL